jgi:hypothetical protein
MEDLFERVVAPLVLGGEVRPARPIGAALALRMGELAPVFRTASSEGTSVERTRSRRARALLAVERAPALSREEWLLTAAFNDFLQVSNPHLAPVFRTSWPARLLASIEQTLAAVKAPTSLLDVVARHATFARAFEITRLDTLLAWWTGRAEFLGEAPPPRLLAWPTIRRVQSTEVDTSLRDLARRAPINDDAYQRVIARFLGASPLTDLVTSGREDPPFVWTALALSVVASPLGAAVARRALSSAGDKAHVAITRATAALVKGPARDHAESFLARAHAHHALSP